MNTNDFSREEAALAGAIAANIPAANLTSGCADKLLSISLFSNVRDNRPKQEVISWFDLIDSRFTRHCVRADKKDAPCWSPASYLDGKLRKAENVTAISCAVFDIEHHSGFESVRERLTGYAFIAHSTFRHTEADPRYRIILPLQNGIDAANWPEIWERLNLWIGGINDPQTKDASRLYALPSRPPEAEEHFIEQQEGRSLPIEDLPILSAKAAGAVRVRSTKDLRKVRIEGIEEAPLDPLNPAIGLARVVARCAFMQWASAPGNHSQVSYPLWRAMISNASRFEDSESWIHQASCEHHDYDEAETQKQIDDARSFGIPITCATIRQNGFAECPAQGCIKPSGTGPTGAPAGLWMKESVSAAEAPTEGAAAQDGRYVGSYFVSSEGVFKVSYKDGEEFRTKISSYIEVMAQTRDASSPNWGFLVAVKDPDGHIHEWALPRELLTSSSAWKAQLMKLGADIYQTGKQDPLYEYLLETKPTARALCVTQPGWYRGVFVLPNRVIGNAQGERVVLQTTDVTGGDIFKPCGTLADWQRTVGSLCVGNSRLALAVCAALTGPLLHPLGEENGGFHIVGGSSMGKTTAVEVAASVWGNRSKFVRNWRTTGNAAEAVATRHNDTLLILDEISQVSPVEAGEIAYMLGNGRGKSRANIAGQARANAQWRLIWLSTGEQSLAEHMQTANKRSMAGQEVRLVNIPADAGTGLGLFENLHQAPSAQQFAAHLKHATGEFYGEAGPALVAALADTHQQPALLDAIRNDAEAFANSYIPVGSCGQVLRVGKRFALLAAVGELATRLGILPWPAGEAIAAARICFQAWIDGRGGVSNQEAEQAIAQVRRFLENHGESRFTAWDELFDTNANSRTINRAGFRRVTDDGRTEFYILPEMFKSDVCGGLNSREVAKALRDAGFLVLGSDGKNTKQERLPGIGGAKVYRVKPDILGESEEVVSPI